MNSVNVNCWFTKQWTSFLLQTKWQLTNNCGKTFPEEEIRHLIVLGKLWFLSCPWIRHLPALVTFARDTLTKLSMFSSLIKTESPNKDVSWMWIMQLLPVRVCSDKPRALPAFACLLKYFYSMPINQWTVQVPDIYQSRGVSTIV